MITIRRTIDIDASADHVWSIVGPGFAEIGTWATAIPRSSAITAPGSQPVAGRVCHVRGPAISSVSVTETLIAYDDDRRRLTYSATSGMPRFVRTARNTWTVSELAPDRCRVSVHAVVELHGATKVLAPLLLLVFRRIGSQTLRELRHYAETGMPAPRKRRRLATGTSAHTPAVRKARRSAACSSSTGPLPFLDRFTVVTTGRGGRPRAEPAGRGGSCGRWDQLRACSRGGNWS